MSEELNDIDNLFKNTIEEHSETPSTGVWYAIDQSLDKQTIATLNKKYQRIKWAALLLLLLLIGSGVYLFNHNNNNKNIVVANQSKINNSLSNVTHNYSSDNSNNNNKVSSVNSTNNAVENINTTNNHNNLSINSQAKNHSSSNNIAVNNLSNKTEISKKESLVKNDIESEISSSKKPITKHTKGKIKTTIETATADEESVGNSTTEENKPIINSDENSNTKIDVGENKLINLTTIAFNDNINTNKHININNKTANIKEKSKKSSLFFVSAYVGAGAEFNHVSNDLQHRRDGDDDEDKIKNTEHSQTSFNAGATVGYAINSHWKVQTGIGFTSKEITISPKTILAENDGDDDDNVKFKYTCSSGYYYLSPKSGAAPQLNDTATALTSSNILDYIQIPLVVKYHIFTKSKFSFEPSVGAAINILTKGNAEVSYNYGSYKGSQSINNIIGLKHSYYSGNIAFETQYGINKRMYIGFIPSYNFAITSATQNAPITSKPNSLTFSASVGFKF